MSKDTMEHHLTERELIEYRFRLTSDERLSSAGEHLAGCDACRGRLEQLSRKFASLDLLREDVQVSQELISQVLEQAEDDGRRRMDDGRLVSRPSFLVPRLSFRWVSAVAAVLLVGFVVLIGSLTQKRPAKQEFAKGPELRQTTLNGQLRLQPDADKGEPEMVAMSKPIPATEEPKALLEAEEGSKVLTAAKPSSADVETRPVEALAPADTKADTYAMAAQKPEAPVGEELGEATVGGARPSVEGRVAGETPAIQGRDALATRGQDGRDTGIAEQPPFAPASAIELVTLPRRESVQLTIYNSADLTLVRERRNLTLKKGWNWLQFTWANTLIDPTSLSLEPLERRGEIDVQQLVFPARLRELGRWLIRSQISGQVPFEITYFTSGLSWRAFYMGTLSLDEKTMKLEGYVRVANNSGEDYENAQTRLIVGQVHILDEIAELARRQYPYGRPGEVIVLGEPTDGKHGIRLERRLGEVIEAYADVGALAPKEIKKEGLSEYFLYTIEGTETIPTGWSKRLLSFDVDEVPVINLYKYEEERYGNSVVRFLSFKNDKDHKLGETPIPDGILKAYRTVDDKGHLSYEGQSSFKYIPVDEDVELNLGPVANVVVEPTLIDFKTENYRFDHNRNISGWDEIRTFKIEVRNTRDVPVKIDLQRNFNTQYWKLEKSGDFGQFEKVDLDTVKFTLTLGPRSKKQFEYVLTTYHGVREEDWVRASGRTSSM